MYKKKLLTRLVSGAMVVAVTAGLGLLINGVAGAVPPPGTQGSITINPLQGDDVTPMSATTSGPCPSESKLADLIIVGPVGAGGTAPDTATFPTTNPYPITSVDFVQFSTTQPFVQQFNKLLRDAAAERGRTIQVGEYHLTTRCFDEFTIEVLGTFTGGLIFDTPTHYTVIPNTTPTPTVTPTPTPTVTPTPTPTVTPTPTPTVTPTPTPTVTPTPTPSPGAVATTTTLTVLNFDIPGPGGFVFPIAQVAPNNAAGTVQFKDGNTTIDVSQPVIGGFAFGKLAFLGAGSHSITAVFTPANPAAFKPSTSNTVTVRFK